MAGPSMQAGLEYAKTATPPQKFSMPTGVDASTPYDLELAKLRYEAAQQSGNMSAIKAAAAELQALMDAGVGHNAPQPAAAAKALIKADLGRGGGIGKPKEPDLSSDYPGWGSGGADMSPFDRSRARVERDVANQGDGLDAYTIGKGVREAPAYIAEQVAPLWDAFTDAESANEAIWDRQTTTDANRFDKGLGGFDPNAFTPKNNGMSDPDWTADKWDYLLPPGAEYSFPDAPITASPISPNPLQAAIDAAGAIPLDPTTPNPIVANPSNLPTGVQPPPTSRRPPVSRTPSTGKTGGIAENAGLSDDAKAAEGELNWLQRMAKDTFGVEEGDQMSSLSRSLIAAGGAMMSGGSPWAMQNIGAGITEGGRVYNDQMDNRTKEQIAADKLAMEQAQQDLMNGYRASQEARAAESHLTEQQKAQKELEKAARPKHWSDDLGQANRDKLNAKRMFEEGLIDKETYDLLTGNEGF